MLVALDEGEHLIDFYGESRIKIIKIDFPNRAKSAKSEGRQAPGASSGILSF